MTEGLLDIRAREFLAGKEAEGVWPSGGGVAVSLVHDDTMTLSAGYGLRERDRNLPVTPDTLFEIGSLTKGFTATALSIAAEAGAIDLQSPINASRMRLALSDPDVTREIAIADILSHRTGVPSHDLLWYLGGFSPEELRRRLSLLGTVAETFRRAFFYNNIMYGALGHLFEDLVGERLSSYMARTILTPLTMTSTCFNSPADENVALPYIGTRRATQVDMRGVAAAGGLKSTIGDLAKWIQSLLKGGATPTGAQLLSESSFIAMWTPHIGVENASPLLFQGLEWLDAPVSYGLGWFLGFTRGERAVFHPGFLDGFSGAVVVIPQRKIGAVALANVNLSPVPGLLLQELINRSLDRSSGERDQLKETPTVFARSAVGIYENPAFGRVSVTLRGSQSMLEYGGHQWPLTWKGEQQADTVLTAFGLQIPLTVQLETENGETTGLSIPFSLDPRIKPYVFVRQS